MKRISFTMLNAGFRHVCTHGKVLLITYEYENHPREMRGLAVFGIPATAVKGLTWQSPTSQRRLFE